MKAIRNMHIDAKRILSVALTLVMLLGLFPGMSLTAYAATDTYTTLKNNVTVVKFNDYNWYIIEDNSTSATEGTVTLLAADNGFGLSKFSDNNSSVYSSSKIKATLDAMTQEGGAFADVADAIVSTDLEDVSVTGAKLYLLSTGEAQNLNSTILNYNFPGSDQSGGSGAWWLRSPGSDPAYANTDVACVFANTGVFTSGKVAGKWTFGVRPALKLDLSKVYFSSNTFSTEPPPHTHSFTYSVSGATITATCSADDCDLTDNKATLTIGAPAKTTYGDANSAVATITDENSIQGDAKVQYQTKSGNSYGDASENAPTDAGSYKASITLGGATASVEYTIAKANPTANAPTGLTATYGQTLADVSLENKNPDGNTAGTWAWADAESTSVGTVGDRTFKANFTPADTTNFNSIQNIDVTIAVGKADNPATIADTATVTRGGNTVDLADNVMLNGATGTVSYEISGEDKGCSLNGSVLTSGDNTGSVTVNVTVAADDNYNALAATPITVTISDKGTQTITADDVTVTYGDTDKKVSATTNGNGAISYAVKDGSGDYIDVNASTGALTIKKVGTATVVVTAAETDTYAQATKEVTVTINKANAAAATVTANSRTYDGTEKPLVTVTGTPTGGTMYYALGTNATTAPADNLYTTSIPAKTDAGTYYVWYKVAGDDNHLDTNPLCVKVKIMNTGMFADIEYGTWKYTAAEAVYEKQIMVGKGMVDGKIIFAPDDKVNRSQLVTSIYAMDGKPDVDYVQRFSDVKESDWFAKAVTWASNNEITAGTVDGQFGATGNATREQVTVMLYKYAQYCGYDVTISESTTLDGFADADKVHSWALDAVKWAVERKIISGKGKSPDLRIAPDQSATRIECAAMLNRFSEVCTLAMIPDEILEEPIALPMEDIEESPASIEEPEEDIEDEIEDIIDDKEEEIIDDEEEEVIDNEEEEIIDNEEEEVIDDEEEEVIDDEKEEVIDNRETEGI